jgi:cytochrome P450 / NADPH-cytochrome P450 reductase
MNDTNATLIPRPKPHPLLGNAPDIDPSAPMQSMMRLAREHGPIFRLETFGKEVIVVSSHELVNELCDETRFDKTVHGVLLQQRDSAGDGLFTAHTHEPNWGLAHRILMPGFAPAWMRNLFPAMWDIAEQMLVKWERLGASQHIDVGDNMTRLTLDTIALCAFNYRFNSFYGEELHPYVGAMVRNLSDSSARANRPALMTRLMIRKARQRAEDVRLMHHTADELIAERKRMENPAEIQDLLGLMLAGKDPKTGERLSDTNIRFQMITFLTAGHETTSGLLTFALYLLLQHPDKLARLRAEVDHVLGNENPRYEHLAKLTYLDRVLKETLRLWPTAPVFSVHPYDQETLIGGKYRIRNDENVLILLPMLHRDPKVWGADVERFEPDRFAPEAFERLPANAWKPFGNGQRACIGRPFALQEATLVLAGILQRFDLSQADPTYRLHVKETLTLKPEGFFIKARRRNVTIVPASKPGAGRAAAADTFAGAQMQSGIPIQVLFGSNSGSAEAFAQRIASDARAQGYVASLSTLDSAVGQLAREGAVVIVTASYEGRPTDNAKQFVPWVEQLAVDALKGVRYVVFGCGNKDWARTYQKVPRRIDEKLQEAGAERLMQRGEADTRGDFFGDFDRWYASFWSTLGAAFGQSARRVAPAPQLELEFVEGARDPLLRQNALEHGEVVENRELVAASGGASARSKRHIEIALPAGARYRSGDYLAVLPSNSPESIARVLRRFELAYDAQVVVHSAVGVQTFLPIGRPVLAGELLAGFVELGQTATRQQIQKLAESTSDPEQRSALERWAASDDAYREILQKRVSVVDLLERFSSCELPFAALLQMLPPVKPRQYSISSSPLWSAEHCTITVAVLESPAWSGHGTYRGVASNYLAHARPGMKLAVTTRPSQAAFHLPESLDTPIIMVAAGTGIAPFRGFLQERALRAAEHGALGTALLFFGCNHPDMDFLYKDELTLWEQAGIVRVRPAFSDAPDGDVKYVQHRLWKERAEVMKLMEQGARIYVCGDGQRMAPGVRETFGKMYQALSGASPAEVETWLAELEQSFRYSQDVFA